MKISLASSWRPDGKTLIHPGIYNVPQDMSKERAEAAIRKGIAFRIDEVKKGAPQNKGNPFRTGEGRRSQSSAEGQASVSKTSTDSTAESSPSTTHGDSAGTQTSSTPATPHGGARKVRRKQSSADSE